MAQNPGFTRQSGARTGFRIAGILLVAIGGLLLVTGVASLFSTMSSDSMDAPKNFWMAFVGMPVLAVGGWCLQAGFVGAASRYVAGETVPVVKDSLEYLTDGRGLGNLGRSAGESRFCTQCGTQEEAVARFCSKCGTALG